MLVEKELQKIFQRLQNEDEIRIHINDSEVGIRLFEQGSKLSLSTQVYYGGNYIPKSVRACIGKKFPLAEHKIQTQLIIDEKNFAVYLHFLGPIIADFSFKDLLEEFTWIADEWRLYLDEHDKNDLVHVRVNK